MESQPRPSLLALTALLLCALLPQTAESGSSASSTAPLRERGMNDVGTSPNGPKQTDVGSDYGNHSPERIGPSAPKIKSPVNGSSFNTSRGNRSTVIHGVSDRAPSWSPGDDGASPLCAYRVIEGGIGGQLCFRHTLPAYKCHEADCRAAVSVGDLVANVLINGSVLLQWTHEGESTRSGPDVRTTAPPAGQTTSGAPGANLRGEGRPSPDSVFGARRHRRGGYELSCWWNGSYAQFECAGVHLGSGCRDFLLAELHENTPYRICLRSLARLDPAPRADPWRCVDFTLPQSGMQDIVIAMTAVGGAICVMLVIICLLVAYITENIMSPPMQRSHSHRSHSHRSHSRHNRCTVG